MGAVVGEDRAGVVELVGRGDVQLVGELVRDRSDVRLLPLPPSKRSLRSGVSVSVSATTAP